MRQRSIVAVANEQVSILLACRLIGMQVPDMIVGKRAKVYCPFGPVWHSDHGMAKAMGVYPDSNNVWCFAGCGYFTPVSLVATAWDRDPQDVAVELLDKVGYKPVSLAQAWQEVLSRQQAPDISMLNLALRTYCARIAPDWASRQFDSGIAKALDRCLKLLNKVRSEADAQEWLSVCKLVMSRVLEESGADGPRKTS